MTSGQAEARWGIWIDIEGFSKLWSAGDVALQGLSHLTRLIFALGTRCYVDEPERLFAHQIGDGFYIASDFHEASLDRCAAIAVSLLRGLTAAGCVGRAAIAEGDLADYSGCRPPEVQAAAARSGDTDVVSLGAGLMTLQAVMGQGIVNAVTLDKLVSAKGSLLCLATSNRPRLSGGFVTRPVDDGGEILALDWVHSASPLIDHIASRAGFGGEHPSVLEQCLRAYVEQHDLPRRWRDATFLHCGLSPAGD